MGWDAVPGRPGRNSTDASEACQARPQPIPECLCHRHRGERRGPAEHLRKQSLYFFFLLRGDWEGKQAGPASVCIRLSDVLQNDPSRLISNTLTHHIRENVMREEAKLSTLCEQAP